MQPTQMAGLRMLFTCLGWAIGYFLFGTETGWLSIPMFLWCGMAGMIIGTLLGGQPSK